MFLYADTLITGSIKNVYPPFFSFELKKIILNNWRFNRALSENKFCDLKKQRIFFWGLTRTGFYCTEIFNRIFLLCQTKKLYVICISVIEGSFSNFIQSFTLNFIPVPFTTNVFNICPLIVDERFSWKYFAHFDFLKINQRKL